MREIADTFTEKPRTFLYNQWMKGFSQTFPACSSRINPPQSTIGVETTRLKMWQKPRVSAELFWTLPLLRGV